MSARASRSSRRSAARASPAVRARRAARARDAERRDERERPRRSPQRPSTRTARREAAVAFPEAELRSRRSRRLSMKNGSGPVEPRLEEHPPGPRVRAVRGRCAVVLGQAEEVAGRRVLQQERGARAGEDPQADPATTRWATSAEPLGSGELAPELEQRGRALGLAPLRLVQASVLERDRRVSGEHLEQRAGRRRRTGRDRASR